jgi:two-component system NarL family sensor kinase
MKLLLINFDVVIVLVFGTITFFIVLIFVIIFIVRINRKQIRYIQEKAALKAQFEQEILNAENEIQDATMKHISRELHDNVGQMLTLVKIQLNNLSEESPDNKKINDSKEFVNNVLTDIRALSKSLNSDNLLHEGLEKAIGFEVERVKKLGNYAVNFSANTGIVSVDRKKEVLIFRIFQELLQNCLKHAKAKNIEVSLEETMQCLNLEVVDDGIGFDFETRIQKNGFQSGAGLSNLIHRAALMNGTLVFERGKVSGTKAQLTIPV